MLLYPDVVNDCFKRRNDNCFNHYLCFSNRHHTYFQHLPEEVLKTEVNRDHFPFSQQLFWGTPIDANDMEKHKNYIIERVIVRGLLADFYWLLKTDNRDEIATALKKSRTLNRKTNHFCSEYFDIPLNELRASSFTVDLNRYGLLKKSFTLE